MTTTTLAISSSFALFLLATTAPSFVQADTYYALNAQPSCNHNLQLTVDYLSCDNAATSGGAQKCSPGDSVYASGSITMGDYDLQGWQTTHKACLYGLQVGQLCQDVTLDEDFCTLLFSEEGINEENCPSTAGTGPYKWSSEFSIPEEADLNISWSYSITVYTTLTNEDGTQYTCSTKLDGTHGDSTASGDSSSARVVGWSVVGGIALVGSLLYGKRRRTALLTLDEQGDATAASTNFEMMTSPVDIGAGVRV